MIEKKKVLVVDIDGTLCDSPVIPGDYIHARPYQLLIEKLAIMKEKGFYIILQTSRQMRTYEGNVGKLTAHMLPVLTQWLEQHHVVYDEIHIGKPWCGSEGFYIDDKAVRPSEFLTRDYEEIIECLKEDKRKLILLHDEYKHSEVQS